MSDFIQRHVGIDKQQQQAMLADLGFKKLDDFINSVIPQQLLSKSGTMAAQGLSEDVALTRLRALFEQNKLSKSYIGFGYYDTITPAVIRRNIFENPGWYTAYTPYQAEISQGRLEMLLNYQQMICDLTGFALSNASLLDEATAAAEAMAMARRINPTASHKFFVDSKIFPQTISVLETRAKYLNIELVIGDVQQFKAQDYFGIIIQNPDMNGNWHDYTKTIEQWKQLNSTLVISSICDILSLTLFKSPAQQGVDIAIGSTQRFGIPMGFGGPSAAYLAIKDQYKRLAPGRIIGISVDARGKQALRMSLQTREQHIRREKANSNICTSTVLLANMTAAYAMYHGSDGIQQIAKRITYLANLLAHNLHKNGVKLLNSALIFDTISFQHTNPQQLLTKLAEKNYTLGYYNDQFYLSVGERASLDEIKELSLLISNNASFEQIELEQLLACQKSAYRSDAIFTHPIFNKYQTESKMMRYLKMLENKDLSLVHSMIPLGSCTMKLNAAAELEPLLWPTVANIHPFAPHQQIKGYLSFIKDFKQQLMAITGFSEICLQPNSGAQGEYTGLLTIRRYQEARGEGKRNICLIPKSAHGTNPATAQMMGLEVVVVGCDEHGNVNVADLEAKAQQYKEHLCCLMITYPSTHGVFEAGIKKIAEIIHACGGQVYMDGANLNALVGLVKPVELGADVSHINLHKTFAIPHGGGGPGMGPIGVKQHLVEFLPRHVIFDGEDYRGQTAVSSSQFGSASVLTISWMYNIMLGGDGLKLATQAALLNANYLAHHLTKIGYTVLYTGQNNHVAHECIIDLRPIKARTGVTEVDFAKRLMDYGFHAPTMSFPVVGTLMVEPTESEDKDELDRFINAMAAIYQEVEQLMAGAWSKDNNPLKNAPHTLADLMLWNKPYSAEVGCFPTEELKKSKLFPTVNRIDDPYGDRNFMCSCFDFS